MIPSRHTAVSVVIGDMFESDAQTLVNTVNTVGVMGKGVALEFKKRFPDMYDDYVQRCAEGEVRLGRPYLYRSLLPPFILNFPTKEHWRSVSRLSDIIDGLDFLEEHYREWGIESLACPPLGCGQGGLEWRIVGPLLYKRLERLEIPVTLFAPFGTSHEELTPEYLATDQGGGGSSSDVGPSKVAPAWVALVAVLARLEHNRFRWPVGRTTFQKLTYFATVAGLPTGLAFRKGTYGPYADSLKSIQSKLVNNGLLVEKPLGNMIEYRVGPTYEAAAHEFQANLDAWESKVRDVALLLGRMRTREAEVAASAHFAASALLRETEREPTEREVLEAVLEWKSGKKPALTDTEVADAIRNLALLGWLNTQWSEDLPVEDLSEAAF